MLMKTSQDPLRDHGEKSLLTRAEFALEKSRF